MKEKESEKDCVFGFQDGRGEDMDLITLEKRLVEYLEYLYDPPFIMHAIRRPIAYCLEENLEEFIEENKNPMFREILFRFIDDRGLTDAEVYKLARIDRRLFSKIRCNKEYNPSKETVLALSIALKLNIDDTNKLLESAGFSLSNSSKFDLILKFFITNEVYDFYKINQMLYKYSEKSFVF